MFFTMASEEGLRRRRVHAVYDNVAVRDYWREPDRPSWPHAYLVEQAPHSTIRPHFHAVDQFQVIVQGGGKLGPDDVGPVTVHYADAFTGYGPINSSTDGLFYFTFRTTFDTGLHALPESRQEQRRLRAGRPRHRVGRVPEHADGPAEWEERTLIPREGDGLGATFRRIPPDEAVTLPNESGGGCFMLVLSGVVTREGLNLAKWSCLYATTDEPTIRIAGGADGASVLAMGFPRARAGIEPSRNEVEPTRSGQ